ncbi:MAG: aspartate--tRNA ligase [Candidatus Ancillula sp.]|jgi:aspartyl-tRNA synthetase|nr:aspartate--tRNA ligase [Candidatus Ancillula sp.]
MSLNEYRTHYAGKLGLDDVSAEVVLSGWVDRRRDHGGVAFIDLRDKSGIAQVVVNDEEVARPLRSEFVLKITGIVSKRPSGQENNRLATGQIEVIAKTVEVLSTSDALPFQVSTALEEATDDKVGEDVRLKYRYLDLRRPSLNNALRLRSRLNQVARNFLDKQGFFEIETPTLIRSTPEGARDFLVPARLNPGSWYALPQSPQLFKQLLMVSGFEKYFQIARCYRDEDFRSDRQPEFTQLDIELSFITTEDIYRLTEELLRELFRLIDIKLPDTFPRLSYADAMSKYGSDKPDLRFGNEIVDLTQYFKSTPFRVFQAPFVGAIRYPGGASLPRRQFDAWQEWAKSRGARGLAYVQFTEDGLTGPVAKNLSEQERDGLLEASGAKIGDAIFFAAGSLEQSRNLLAMVRVEIARRLGVIDTELTGVPKADAKILDEIGKPPFGVTRGSDGRVWSLLWVVDFPLFKSTTKSDDDDISVGSGDWTAVHHAFTLPSDLENFDKEPEVALSDSYDIVLNGNEIGGGSIRIHQADIQQRVFDLMGIKEDEANEKFGFLIEALKFGAPPHGGIALGWDRIIALMSGTLSIRDVIAFPKTGGGVDLMQNAPAIITHEQRAETGVDAVLEHEDA